MADNITFEELVSRYLDDDLDPAQASQVKERIDSDPESHQIYQDMRTTMSLVGELAAQPLSAPSSLMAGIREAMSQTPWYKRWANWLVGGPILTPARGLSFVLVAAVVAGVLVGTPAFKGILKKEPAGTVAYKLSDEVAPVAVLAKAAPEPEAVPAIADEKDVLDTEKLPALAAGEEKEAEKTVAVAVANHKSATVKDRLAASLAVPGADSSGTTRTGGIDISESTLLKMEREETFRTSSETPPVVAGAEQPPSPYDPVPVNFVIYEPGIARRPNGYPINTVPAIGGSRGGVSTAGATVVSEVRLSPAPADESGVLEEEALPTDQDAESDELAEGKSAKGISTDKAEPKKKAIRNQMRISKRLIRCKLSPRPMAGNEREDAGDEPVMTFDKANLVKEHKGSYSGLKQRSTYVAEDRAAWTKLWTDLTSNMVPPPSVPDIDFGNNFAIGVSMGEKSSGGFAITIEEIELSGKVLKVHVHETLPGRNAPGGMTLALTQPYHILILPRNMNRNGRFVGTDGYTVEFIYE